METEKMQEVGDLFTKVFSAHGHFCASHPLEVIVTTLILVVGTLSHGGWLSSHRSQCNGSCSKYDQDKLGIDVPMTIMLFLACLYVYQKFLILWKTLGSKHILGIAFLFTLFSSCIFSSSVVNFLQTDISELFEALPFFLLLIDLSRASLLAQYALRSTSQKEVKQNIARGMSVLGPAITLDTLVQVLVIGVGTLSGVRRLEIMCRFSCMSVIVNYFVFMTFFPACLALALEIKLSGSTGLQDNSLHKPLFQLPTFPKLVPQMEQKQNPALQSVKLIVSAGLLLVHVHSRWPIMLIPNGKVDDSEISSLPEFSPLWLSNFYQWITFNLDKLPVLVFALPLAFKYVILENWEASNKEVRIRTYSRLIPEARDEDAPLKPSANQNNTKPDLYKACPDVCEEMARIKDLIQNKPVIKEPIRTLPDLPDVTANTPEVIRDEQENPRTLDQCIQILESGKDGAMKLTDAEIVSLVQGKRIPAYNLERVLSDPERGVAIRRRIISEMSGKQESLSGLPYLDYDYKKVMGACCENVIGYMPVPVGVAGPLLMNGKQYYVPMATTEGCLVASTNRGCRAIQMSGGVQADVFGDGMTRGPVTKFPSAHRAVCAMQWISEHENFLKIKEKFDSTSRFGRLQQATGAIAGDLLFIRFKSTTGDAMGMNMVSKGVEASLDYLQEVFPDMQILGVSGNYCIDKKPGALNWIEGRGKSVTCEARIPGHIIRDVLKTTAKALVEVNTSKNLIGSAMAGSIGGFNAQASNIVTAIYIATGQDPAQNVCSSNCMTLINLDGPDSEGIRISCTMPSIELGTVGGGTVLSPQGSCLDLLGVRGACQEKPGHNARTLAQIVCGAVLAGELSLLSAIASGFLVKSHMTHNRSSANASPSSSPTQ